MTKDEAIKILQTEMECVKRPDCDRLACAYCDLAMRAEDVLTAYQMAITALQTDGDCISRQAAIEAVLDMNAEHCVSWLDAVVDTLDALPSARPEILACGNGELNVQPEWNNHTVACMLAELFDDTCACNYNGIDEWLPEKCEVIDACPNPVGVACWEQYLKHRAERRTDE